MIKLTFKSRSQSHPLDFETFKSLTGLFNRLNEFVLVMEAHRDKTSTENQLLASARGLVSFALQASSSKGQIDECIEWEEKVSKILDAPTAPPEEGQAPSSSTFYEVCHEDTNASACLETLQNLVNAGMLKEGDILIQDLDAKASFIWFTN